MASNTPWILRASDPIWREDHDYKKGHRICGSDGAIYIARQDSGPNTAVGIQNPVTETSGDYWISLANSLKSGGANELTGATTAKKLETKIVIDGVAFDGSADISNYTVCETQSSAQAKTVSIPNFNLVKGGSARIRFTNGNTHTSPTLNISDTGARELRLNNEAIKDYYIDKNGTYDVVYDGTYYQIVNGGVNVQNPKANQLTTERTIQGVKFDGTGDITNYTICTTDSTDGDKKVNLPGFTLSQGAILVVKFVDGSTTNITTLNVNGTGGKEIKWNGEDLKDYFIDTNGTYVFVFDGEYYQLINGGPSKTSNSAQKLEIAYTINGIEFDGTGDITNYGICDTAADKASKTVTIKGFKLITGASIKVFFTYGSTTSTTTLNVNGTGEKPLKRNGEDLNEESITKSGTYDIIFDGTCFQIVSGGGTTAAEAAKLAQEVVINGVKFDGSGDLITYGVCTTAADAVQKTVALANFSLVKGATVNISFTKGNTVEAPTLNINGTGAKILKYNGLSLKKDYIAANSTYTIVYDGTYYQLVGRQLGGEMPIGGIIAFSGKFSGRYPIPGGSTLPDTNWVLCDGTKTNNLAVPDLRGRFICGAAVADLGKTGGADSITPSGSVSVSIGNHALGVAQIPAHRHKVANSGVSWDYGWQWADRAFSNCDSGGGGNNQAKYSSTTEGTGNPIHSHGASASFSGNALDNRPKYYNLCYIMRIA